MAITNLSYIQCSLWCESLGMSFPHMFRICKRIKIEKKKELKTEILSSCKIGIYESPEREHMAICLI